MNHEVFLLLVVGVLATGNPVPQSLRLGGGEVGASFGGYSASAGLGGLLGGGGASAGGLHAEAGTPNGPAAAAGLGGLLGGGGGGGGKLYSGATVGGGGPSAAAGLGGLLGGGGGGGKLYSGASTGGGGGFGGGYGGGYGGGNYIYGGGGPKGGFFDRIFDIPISTLNAVNRMLNEGGGRRTGAGVSKSRSSSSSSSSSKVVGHGDHLRTITKTKSKSVSRQYAAPPQGGATFASASSSAGVQPAANYDRVFDIPRSVLSAVNRFLNEGR